MSKAKRTAKKTKRKEKRAAKKAAGGTKVGKALRKVKSTAKKAVNKLKEVGGFAVLLPFRKSMERLLSAKGVQPATKFDDLVQQFKTVIIDKKSSFDESPQPIQHLLPVVIGTIIDAIVGFFKNLKEKKASGAQMSDAENNALDLAETAAEDIKQEIESEAKEKAFEPMFFIIIVVIIILIFK